VLLICADQARLRHWAENKVEKRWMTLGWRENKSKKRRHLGPTEVNVYTTTGHVKTKANQPSGKAKFSFCEEAHAHRLCVPGAEYLENDSVSTEGLKIRL
jgi:hypothetical protein